MGHRDIWGKDKSKWKKMCPCFDAEAEYAGLDNVVLEKYDDATEPIEPVNIMAPVMLSNAVVETKSIWDKIRKLCPWKR